MLAVATVATVPLAGNAATLDLDTLNPPVVVRSAPEIGPAAATIRFPDGLELATLPAVVVTLAEGAPLPSFGPKAELLGATGRAWRIPTDDVSQAIALASALSDAPGVTSAMPDLVIPRVRTDFDDPNYPSQWYSELLEMDLLYAESLGDPDVRVAVLDSGIQLDHPDLVGSWVDPFDAYDGDDDPSPNPGEYCNDGSQAMCDDHGTAVAGIIAARANNGEAIVGLCPECTLVPVKLLGEGGGGISRDINAFDHAIAADVAVINNSWGFVEAIPVPAPLAEVIRRAATEPRDGLGAVVVFAAGNDDRVIRGDEMQAMEEVLCVSATDRYGLPTAYTNSGASVDVSAPSATVTLNGQGGLNTTFGGTSAAAPVVSGLAAWVLSVEPSLSADEVRQMMIEAAVPSPQVTHDDNGHHPVYGYGEVSAVALLEMLRPPVEEPEARACGCATDATPALWLLPVMAALLVRRRRD